MFLQSDSPTGEPSSHLDALTLAALADQRVEAVQRAEVEAHLAACGLCRSELYALRSLLRTLPARRSASIRRVMFSAAAAALALLVLNDTAWHRSPAAVPGLERSAPAAARKLSALEPRSGSIAPRTGLRFVWEGAGKDSRYQLTVVDSLGGELWRIETTDTFVVAPATLALPQKTLLFWYVDALGPDARFHTTRAVALRLKP